MNIFIEETMAPYFSECEAVLSCLSTNGQSFGRTVTFYMDSISAISAAMKTAGVSRFIGVTEWGTQCRCLWCISILVL